MDSLLCNLIVFHTAIDMMEVIRQLVGGEQPAAA